MKLKIRLTVLQIHMYWKKRDGEKQEDWKRGSAG